MIALMWYTLHVEKELFTCSRLRRSQGDIYFSTKAQSAFVEK